jgi:hypothetical protein
MTYQKRIRKYEIYDFVSTPIGMEAGSSMGNVNEVPDSPPIPSFYRGPDLQDAETK